MKLEQKHIDQIKSSFQKVQTRQDFLNLLNEAKPFVYGENAIPFDLKQLTWYANPRQGRKRYSEFKIKKKSGDYRTINAPVRGLKALQKTLNFILQCVFDPHKASMGFVRNKSIVENAKIHTGSKYVYNIDLKDFFSSIDQARVWKCLQLQPFNLNKESSAKTKYIKWEDFNKNYLKTDENFPIYKIKDRLFIITPLGRIWLAKGFNLEQEKFLIWGNSNIKSRTGISLEGTPWLVNRLPKRSKIEIANIVASICCTEMEVERKNEESEWEIVKRYVLPQGAPTSPVITNIVCQRLDFLLSGLSKRFGLNYSRYADDITFSSMHNVYQKEGEFLKELHRIIDEQGFHIKECKTRLQKEGYRKEVTGLLVNEKVNIQKRYIKQLRMWLYYWERYGYERAYGFFLQQYLTNNKTLIGSRPDMTKVVEGKLNFLRMVKGVENDTYLKLKQRFNKLVPQANPISDILDIWEKEGIERAMEKYYGTALKKPRNEQD